ncbi:hypothetical protein [Clostridium sp.]|nr:hypothetical protein [Clostridium sp.]
MNEKILIEVSEIFKKSENIALEIHLMKNKGSLTHKNDTRKVWS